MTFNKTSTGYNDNTSLIGLGLQHVVEGAILCGVYKIVSPSCKIYIGKSKNILKRISYYKNLNCKSQARLYYSLKKYGWKSHIFEIIHECPEKDLNLWENYYIKFYDSFNTTHGLNLTSGGEGGTLSESTCKKISIALKGKPRYSMRGRKQSKETIIKRTIKLKGKIRSIDAIKRTAEAKRGTKHSIKSLQKMSLSRKAYIKKYGQYNIVHSKETKEKMRAAKLGKKQTVEAIKNRSLSRTRKIEQIDTISNVIIKVWNSTQEASNTLNINRNSIALCCRGLGKTAGGFKWKKIEK